MTQTVKKPPAMRETWVGKIPGKVKAPGKSGLHARGEGEESAQGCIPKRLLGRPDEALGGGNQCPSAPGWGRQHHSQRDPPYGDEVKISQVVLVANKGNQVSWLESGQAQWTVMGYCSVFQINKLRLSEVE